MWRLLFIASLLPILAAVVAHWWFAKRVLVTSGRRLCQCQPARWQALFSTPIAEAEAPAAAFGSALRDQALAEWKSREPKLASSREKSRRFGKAVPPLSLMVAIFALILAKIPLLGAASILLASTALSALIGLLTLGPELRAIAPVTRKLRESRIFVRRDDEDATVASAIARAWAESIPPIIRWF